MTGVSPTNSNSNSSSNSSLNSLSQNFDQFLNLMLTQLKNQNPLDPLDTNQFTQQLVSFSAVEQQVKSNESLNSLLLGMNASNAMNALNFVGKTVTLADANTELKNGSAKWKVTSDRAGKATVTVRDSNGNTVNTYPITMSGSAQDFKWDGTTSNGTKAPDGKYSISIDGKDSQGNAMKIDIATQGLVDSVDLTKSPPYLNIGTLSLPLSSIKSVGTAT